MKLFTFAVLIITSFAALAVTAPFDFTADLTGPLPVPREKSLATSVAPPFPGAVRSLDCNPPCNTHQLCWHIGGDPICHSNFAGFPVVRREDRHLPRQCSALCKKYSCCVGDWCRCGWDDELATFPEDDLINRSPMPPFPGAEPSLKCIRCNKFRYCWAHNDTLFCNSAGEDEFAYADLSLPHSSSSPSLLPSTPTAAAAAAAATAADNIDNQFSADGDATYIKGHYRLCNIGSTRCLPDGGLAACTNDVYGWDVFECKAKCKQPPKGDAYCPGVDWKHARPLPLNGN